MPGCGLNQSVSQAQARRSYSSRSTQSAKQHTACLQREAGDYASTRDTQVGDAAKLRRDKGCNISSSQ